MGSYIPPNNYAFIDGSNLHITYTKLKEWGIIDWEIDYQRLRHYLKKRHNVTVAYYFVGYRLVYSDIYGNLREYGYELKHEVANNLDEFLIKQAKWDINKYDKAIIITGDKDFAELVKLLDSQNKLKLVLAPSDGSCAKALKDAANTKIEFLNNFEKEIKKKEG
jgi:uncharacterized LabA/DUF88 family protein